MPEVIGFLLLVGVPIGLVWVRRRWRSIRWRVAIRTAHDITRVSVCRGPCGLLGSAKLTEVPVSAPDYDQRLSDVEATAFQKVAALNATERVNRHRR